MAHKREEVLQFSGEKIKVSGSKFTSGLFQKSFVVILNEVKNPEICCQTWILRKAQDDGHIEIYTFERGLFKTDSKKLPVPVGSGAGFWGRILKFVTWQILM